MLCKTPFWRFADAPRLSCLRPLRDQPHQSLGVVGHALERDGQLVPGQRHRPHHLAAQLLQSGEHVLDSGPDFVDRPVARETGSGSLISRAKNRGQSRLSDNESPSLSKSHPVIRRR